jgi:hypothetical protein
MKNILLAIIIATIGLVLIGCEKNEPEIKLLNIKETVTTTVHLIEYTGNYGWGGYKDGYPKTLTKINYYNANSITEVTKKNINGSLNINSGLCNIDGKSYGYYQDINYIYEIIK